MAQSALRVTHCAIANGSEAIQTKAAAASFDGFAASLARPNDFIHAQTALEPGSRCGGRGPACEARSIKSA
jgi:hypothetical protein